jgi:predicted RNA-binding protein associated with RNAse of E/G family
LDHEGREVISYPGEVVERGEGRIVLRTSWEREPMDLGFVVLEPADRWREFFYADRWYNVFEIRDGDGRLKGWYCNITRPARIGPDEVAAEDLALDLWVTPDGASELLDEEEFAELELEPEERRKAREALLDLRHRVETGQSPFGGERQVGDR